MREKTKPKEKDKRETEKKEEVSGETGKDNSRGARARRESSYYYDDAHGYEVYHPGEDDED